MKNKLIFKNNGPEFSIKDVDKLKGIVVGYLSAFGNLDSDNDIIESGAFAKTIAEWGPKGRQRIAHLKDHDMTRLIGKFLELSEDNFGLRFVSQVSKNSNGKDALIEYAEGIINEHSVRIQVLKSEDDQENDIRLIKEVRLWEGSAVTWGANAETPTVDVKNLNELDKYELVGQLSERINILEKYIKIGEFSDKKLELIEMEFKQVQSMLDLLNEPLADTQPEPKKEDTALQTLIEFNKNLKS